MSVINLLFLIFTSMTLQAATWTRIYKSLPGAAMTTAISTCPAGYIGVPPLVPYTYRYFCVSKYEMKKDPDGATPVATPAGDLWVNITRDNARIACQGLGANYDMISNDQWQTIARNIAGVASNWSGNAVASGQLNRGHTDNVPNVQLNAVADDNDGCNGTGQTCSSTVWDSQRRTHKLSNGNVIWDLAGNLGEWVTNDNTYAYPTDTNISQMNAGDRLQINYGARIDTICAAPTVTPFCGMGKGLFVAADIGIESRGGTFSVGVDGGIFTADTRDKPANYWPDTGFRCVYIP